MMAALLSLHDFYVRNQDPEAKTLFDRGILALEAEIHLYDDEGYSFYSMRGNPSGHYHGHHVGQLEALVSITGSRVLDEFREKWASYSLAGQLMKYPTAESLVIISLNFLALVGGFSLLIWLLSRYRKQPGLPESRSGIPLQDESI